MQAKGDIMRRFDYGPARNFQIHGTSDAEHYNFDAVTDVKICAYVAKDDFLEGWSSGIEGLMSFVNNRENVKIRKLENWGHATFYIGKDVKNIVDEIMDDIENF